MQRRHPPTNVRHSAQRSARGAVAFQFDVPLTDLKPGTYVCQINVIDDAGGSFSFPRIAVRVLPPPRSRDGGDRYRIYRPNHHQPPTSRVER